MTNIYGYARVSSKEQNEERQLLALKAAGLNAGEIYTDKQSGSDFLRPQYQKLLQRLQHGDLLYIKSIDRLGRNYPVTDSIHISTSLRNTEYHKHAIE